TVTSPVLMEPVPRDYVLWSFFNSMFCNPCCLGFIAFIYSIKARDRKIAQDLAGASTYGQSAKKLNIIAVCVGVLTIILSIVLLVVY
ncbi:Interferon-induced transmembrane protein 3, partial [Mesitornis unicolor]